MLPEDAGRVDRGHEYVHGKSVSDSISNVARTKPAVFADFRGRCTEKLEKLGDAGIDSQNQNEV